MQTRPMFGTAYQLVFKNAPAGYTLSSSDMKRVEGKALAADQQNGREQGSAAVMWYGWKGLKIVTGRTVDQLKELSPDVFRLKQEALSKVQEIFNNAVPLEVDLNELQTP